ncbi:MAG TPA: tyrosine-type recombinase/integrase [Streptosporangiaceae bacterium]|nr:tyrosine-type recombinase/integrase [Streptosporangiaceae bacterium]
MSTDATPSVTSMREARRSRARRAAVSSGPALSTFIASWQLALEAAAKSSRTVRSYTDSARTLCRFLVDHDMPASVEDVDAPHIRAFLLAEERRTSAASAAVHFRNVRVFFGWLASEGERENPNPMDRVEAPKITKKAKAFFTEEELTRLLKTCSGATFVDRRDTAIIRVFIDTGMRVSAMAGLRYDPDDESANDVFLAQRRLRIRLKGGDEIWVPIGKKSAAALDKYIRARARHPQASSPWLWLGVQGHNTARMTDSGIRDMVGRRGEQAGIQNVHPHRFRRSFADSWLAAGGSTDDLMHITGWKTYDMVREYTEARGIARAHNAHARLSPGDRI